MVAVVRLLLFLLVAALALVFVSSALPATAQVDVDSDSALTYEAGAGEANVLRITSLTTASGARLTDPGATITPGAGCTTVDAHTVECSFSGGATVFAGDMDDFVSLAALRGQRIDGMHLVGGDGDDVLVGSPEQDSISGGPGADTLWGASTFLPLGNDDCETCGPNFLDGGPGDDLLLGGPRRDELTGGPGDDILSGGGGQDFADYFLHPSAIVVTLDDRRGDGSAGEKDDVRSDVEGVFGTDGNDRLIGNGSRNYLDGSGGNDLLIGRAGNDSLFGRRGSDRLEGGPGRDLLSGREGADMLRGGRGRDRALGGRADDTFRMRDGLRDVVRGGSGRDRARVDGSLDVLRSIERLL